MDELFYEYNALLHLFQQKEKELKSAAIRVISTAPSVKSLTAFREEKLRRMSPSELKTVLISVCDLSIEMMKENKKNETE
jgi:intracellular sulfur oxidation DsrE/DsrF family protein